jgi:hypothetical protein
MKTTVGGAINQAGRTGDLSRVVPVMENTETPGFTGSNYKSCIEGQLPDTVRHVRDVAPHDNLANQPHWRHKRLA